MRSSCNGCRVLRKGCSEECTIRPCLQWIKTPESQAQATLFLAKFYGRTGLLNLIHAGPDYLRPAVFKSLLYEACGRIVSPIHGSVGLLWSGEWAKCQAAVESVLAGEPIAVNSGDIRHVSSDDLSEPQRKRTKSKPKPSTKTEPGSADFARFLNPCHEYFWSNNNNNNNNKIDESVLFSDSSETEDGSVARREDVNRLGLDLTLGLP